MRSVLQFIGCYLFILCFNNFCLLVKFVIIWYKSVTIKCTQWMPTFKELVLCCSMMNSSCHVGAFLLCCTCFMSEYLAICTTVFDSLICIPSFVHYLLPDHRPKEQSYMYIRIYMRNFRLLFTC